MTFGKSEKSREDNFKTQGGETLKLRVKTTKLKEKTQGLGDALRVPKTVLNKSLAYPDVS